MSVHHPVEAAPPEKRSARLPVWLQAAPFVLLHLALVAVFFVPVSWGALALCAANYLWRMFGITAGYHRYFAHRSYRVGRPVQFVLAVGGCAAVQKGPLWWASQHRDHHKYADTALDLPLVTGRGLLR